MYCQRKERVWNFIKILTSLLTQKHIFKDILWQFISLLFQNRLNQILKSLKILFLYLFFENSIIQISNPSMCMLTKNKVPIKTSPFLFPILFYFFRKRALLSGILISTLELHAHGCVSWKYMKVWSHKQFNYSTSLLSLFYFEIRHTSPEG